MRLKFLTILLSAALTVSGCQPTSNANSAPTSACRFKITPPAKESLFRAADDYSSPPGLYAPATAGKQLKLNGKTLQWGSWYLNGKLEQLYVQIGDETGWLDTTLPLSSSQRTLLKRLYPQGAILGVPFNQGQTVLIRQDGPSYSIVDLKSGHIVWRDQGRYEAPTIDFATDLLHCHGDLELAEYTFDSDGQPR